MATGYFDFSVNINIPDADHATNKTVFIALGTCRLRKASYRFRTGSTARAYFNLVRVPNGRSINTEHFSFVAVSGALQHDPTEEDIAISLRDSAPDRDVEMPITYLNGDLPRDYSLGLVFYESVAGLRDLDILLELTRTGD